MKRHRIVLDTNVLVSALRSDQGGSHKVLRLLGNKLVDFCISVALVLEYESLMKRSASGCRLNAIQKDDILDYICAQGVRQEVHFLWRPVLKDPSDDMVLELAVAAGAAIVTHNKRDFVGADRFGVPVLSPKEFLSTLRGPK